MATKPLATLLAPGIEASSPALWPRALPGWPQWPGRPLTLRFRRPVPAGVLDGQGSITSCPQMLLSIPKWSRPQSHHGGHQHMGLQLPWNRASSPFPTPAAVASLPACADLSQHHTPLPRGSTGSSDLGHLGALCSVTSDLRPSVGAPQPAGRGERLRPCTQAELRISSSRFLQGLQADIEQEV